MTLARQVMELAKRHALPQATGKGPMGHLLQIFVHRSCVDKWVYASLPMGVHDKSRHPLSKYLARRRPISGQARAVVNPSAFMCQSKVRLHAVSTGEAFHNSRPAFQEDLVKLLYPIFHTIDVKET